MSKTETIKFHPKQVADLKRQFPLQDISPSTTIQEIYFNAGIQHAVKYVETKSSTNTGVTTVGRVQTGEN